MTTGAASSLTGLDPVERMVTALLVGDIARYDRAIARLEALKARSLTRLAGVAHASGERSPNRDGIDYARRAMAADIAAATHTHPVAAKHAMEDAETLTLRFPATFEALAGGTISAKHARVITEAGGALHPDARAAFDSSTVPVAETMTPGELSRVAKKRAAEMADLSPRERHLRARERRFVSITDLDDGMSTLRVNGPSLEVHAVYDRLTKLAKIVKHDRAGVREQYRRAVGHPIGAECAAEGCACREVRGSRAAGDVAAGGGDAAAADGTVPETSTGGARSGALTPEAVTAATDHRSLDQLRTDLFIDLLLGAEPTGHDLHRAGTTETLTHIRAEVQVTIPATMILDPDDGTAWLDAGTLISPDTARHLADTSPGWDRLFYRPDTGIVEHIDHYRPTAWQKRALIGRDLTCRFPGCTTPARRADIDHTHAFAEGGRTTLSNLACLCEAHHVMKHQSDWQMKQLDDGVIEWTSPSGYSYATEPPSRVYFREEPTAEPASASTSPPSAAPSPRQSQSQSPASPWPSASASPPASTSPPASAPPSPSAPPPNHMWDPSIEDSSDPADPPPWTSG
ncbi:hypothetical protein GCM10010910_21000 [Microbacterium nanhaiense]|uniref:HNH nuclease domain-containing protein n=1 Tax=Microbacterium nanhaiense TaxID=1301026 RepID=A0ABQ2N417_9MICO|nr:HNH endonuclease signature motif containing protein [Microbacterium nanhaiense]GGO64948.1 hypothetical protein GCM10010910_21000 [Microbacterium nanhaiense]